MAQTTMCDKIQTIGTNLQNNLNARGVTCTFGNTNGHTIYDLAQLINERNLKGIGDTNLKIMASNPYCVSGDTTDIIILLRNGVGTPITNQEVTVSDGTNEHILLTDANGKATLYNQTITQNTTYVATYKNINSTCTIQLALVHEKNALTTDKTWDITLNDANFYIEFIVCPLTDSGAIAYVRFYNSSNQSFVLGDLYSNANTGMNWLNGAFYGKAIETNKPIRVSLTRVGTTLTLTVGETKYVVTDVSWEFKKVYSCSITSNSITDLKLYLI